MSDQTLTTAFLDLDSRLRSKGISVLLGGGFGLYSKQLDLLRREETKTLLPIEIWPQPRSTSDLDLFFPMELMINLSAMQDVRSVIDGLNYRTVAASEFWQFVIEESDVRIDLLTGPVASTAENSLKIDVRRIRPKGDIKLHARHTPEALDLSKNNETVSVVGHLSDGTSYGASVEIPSPFTYLMMKITALGDQIENRDRNLGRYHALDVYRIVAMLTEERFEQTKSQFRANEQSPYLHRVREIVRMLFQSETSLAVLRMKEHEFYSDNMSFSEFLESLKELVEH